MRTHCLQRPSPYLWTLLPWSLLAFTSWHWSAGRRWSCLPLAMLWPVRSPHHWSRPRMQLFARHCLGGSLRRASWGFTWPSCCSMYVDILASGDSSARPMRFFVSRRFPSDTTTPYNRSCILRRSWDLNFVPFCGDAYVGILSCGLLWGCPSPLAPCPPSTCPALLSL